MTQRLIKTRAYDALVEGIRSQIQNGQLQADNYLLPERELAKTYSLSARAVRQGLAKLESEGLIRRHQGKGTIVVSQEARLSPAKEQNVAVLFQGRVRDPSTAEDLDALQQAFQYGGYGTTLYVADGKPELETQIVQQLTAKGTHGLVLYSAHASNSYAHLKAARQSGMKIVVLDHDFPDLDCNFVGIDDQLAAYEATQHLIRLGCQQFVFINSERNWTAHVLRQRGFEQAVAQCNDLPRKIILVPNFETVGQRGEFLRRELALVLEVSQRPIGVLAWWDEVALHAMDLLRGMGCSVPADAKVIGFANDVCGEVAQIPLTTMAIPREQIARLAAMTLMSQMGDPARLPQRFRLESRMIIRDSCGTFLRRDPVIASSVDGAESRV
jgi:DNA-binding LacI/PurR family transcriptional regulator